MAPNSQGELLQALWRPSSWEPVGKGDWPGGAWRAASKADPSWED